MNTSPDLDAYLHIAESLDQTLQPFALPLIKLLRSPSVSVRRFAKYDLWKYFGVHHHLALKQFNQYGPPNKAEVEWWESQYFTGGTRGL